MANDNSRPLTKGMAGLSRSFYETAYDLTVTMSGEGIIRGIKNTSAVVILLTACLEAYVNEYLALMRQMESQKWGEPIAKLDRADLKTKWYEAPLIFGNATFAKGAEPFQSFRLLVSLRNELVHYDPRFRTPSEFPSKAVRTLKDKFPFAYEGTADWTTQVLSSDCARWGCRTAKRMVRRFHEIVGGHDSSAWPHPWPDPP